MQSPLVLLLLLASVSALGTRYVNIQGQLACDNTYDYRDTIVELWERDKVDSDDKLAAIKPSIDGKFNVTGKESELGDVHFFLRIKHRCLLVNNRRDCPSLVDEVDLDSNEDPNWITHLRRSLVGRKQTQDMPKNCLV